MATIMVLTAGSTGDVEPFAVLAGVLAKVGHTGRSRRMPGSSGWRPAVESSSHRSALISTHFCRPLSASGPRFEARFSR
jgi:hypothetical protein